MSNPAILTEGLRKSFGDTHGKTTAVRILTTLLAPDSGRATVAGRSRRPASTTSTS